MSLLHQSVNIFRRFSVTNLRCQRSKPLKKCHFRYFCTELNNTKASEGTKKDYTMQEVKDDLTQIMGIKPGYSPLEESRSHLLQYLPSSQKELEPRSMQDSFSSAVIPLSTNIHLQDKYVTFFGNVRLGRLLEDMDMFAVWVVNKHIKNHKQPENMPSPYTIVTLMVDKIDFTDLKPVHNEDIRLSGHVSWVGRSSVEVVVWLEQLKHLKWTKLTRALFVMVTRNSTNNSAAFINPLLPANDEEIKILNGGESRKINRKQIETESLLKVVPNDEEQMIMHNLYLKSLPVNEISLIKRELPPGCNWMEDATMSNIVFSHPENRNLHNKVFGGFIMRMATELSWSLGYLFSKYRPELKHISDIRFHKPIKVNSLIKMHANVVFTQQQYMQTTVYVESFEPVTRTHNTTNAFHFTYAFPDYLPEVIPQTYREAMMYLDGRRHFLNAVHKSNVLHDIGIKPKFN